MDIIRPVIGIPNYKWKKKAVKFARNNPNVFDLKLVDLSYECIRHEEILCMFDSNCDDYSSSEYFNYSNSIGRNKEDTIKKIVNFKKMYNDIKKSGFERHESNIPIVTEDGCRLDGSHTLSILKHLGYSETKVNIVVYNKIFSKKEIKQILKDNIKYRKETYNL